MNHPSLKIGTWLSIGSPVIAELAAVSGFDWLLLDLEHGNETEAALPNQLRALTGYTTKKIVRVGAPQPDLVARVLDWGADGIMVPHVESAEEAEHIIEAAYYAPRGRRGFSRSVRAHDYGLHPPDENTPAPLVMAQIESIKGVKHAQAIARVDGIDVLFVGPSDLRHDLACNAEGISLDYNSCLDIVLSAARGVGKTVGILLRDIADFEAHASLGFTYIAVTSDLAILCNTYQTILSNHKPLK